MENLYQRLIQLEGENKELKQENRLLKQQLYYGQNINTTGHH
jgi:cell division septum initiation protein DivIVA